VCLLLITPARISASAATWARNSGDVQRPSVLIINNRDTDQRPPDIFIEIECHCFCVTLSRKCNWAKLSETISKVNSSSTYGK
jgi:hypothetical protein